jgi:hypothetical protein
LIFEPHGIRDLLHQYVNEPKSRRVKQNLESVLNSSQDMYNEALRSLNLSADSRENDHSFSSEADHYSPVIDQRGRSEATLAFSFCPRVIGMARES